MKSASILYLLILLIGISCQKEKPNDQDKRIQELEAQLNSISSDSQNVSNENQPTVNSMDKLEITKEENTDEDFNSFYKKFISDYNFHLSRVKFPLTIIQGEPNYETDEWMETEETISNQNYYSKNYFDELQNNEKNAMKEQEKENKNNLSLMFHEESDWANEYFF